MPSLLEMKNQRAKENLLSVVIILLLIMLNGPAHGQQVLPYALFTSGLFGGFDTSGVVPAIELAEELINADSSILPGYNLSHTPMAETECNRTLSFDQYFDTIFPPDNPTVLGLLGCGCSVASTPVAEIVHYNSISMISYVSSSIELNERTRFRNFFRTYPSDNNFAPATLALIQNFEWQRMAFITENEGIFIEALTRIRSILMNNNIEVENRMIPNSDFNSNFQRTDNFFFQDRDIRVFFINTYSDMARRIICEAQQRNLTYPRYVWITYAWYEEKWWTEAVNRGALSCTDNQLTLFLGRSLSLQLRPSLDDLNATTDTLLTPGQFDNLYRTRLSSTESQQRNYTFTFLATMGYDALWTLALALDMTREMAQTNMTKAEIMRQTTCDVNLRGDLVPLENFSYSNQFMGCVIRWNLERTNFTGVSGRVMFDQTGTRDEPTVQLVQYRLQADNVDIQRVGFGQVTRGVNQTLFFDVRENNLTVYPPAAGGTPPDGTPIQMITHLNLGLIIVYYILAGVGLIFSTVCLIFNFTQRNKKVIKLTSPNINYFVIAGSYILYITVFFRLIPSTYFPISIARCLIVTLMTVSGYCFGYGAVLTKMARIYYIFSNPTTQKKKLKDWKLSVGVLIIVGFGLFLTILQVSIPELRPYPTETPNQEVGVTQNELGVNVTFATYTCYSSTNVFQTVWLGLIFIYLALLQVIGIILTIQTRKVKIKLLNDSKYITALIYISSLYLLLIVLVSFAASEYPNVSDAIISGGLVGLTTMFLSLVFIPKMVSLYRDPRGENVFSAFDQQASSRTDRTFSHSPQPMPKPTLGMENSGANSLRVLSPNDNSLSPSPIHMNGNGTVHDSGVGTEDGTSGSREVIVPQTNGTQTEV